jgi:hypothetical protein
MLGRVALVRADVSEERIVSSIIRMEGISELGTTLAISSKLKHTVKKH